MATSVLSSRGGTGLFAPSEINFAPPPHEDRSSPLPPGDSFRPPGEKNLDKTLMATF